MNNGHSKQETSAIEAYEDSDSTFSAVIAALAAALIRDLERPAFFQTVFSGLGELVPINNLIVFVYREGYAAELVAATLKADYLRSQMQPYTNGLYLLDPFYIADVQQQRHGLLHIDEVAPAEFYCTEFYLSFYKAVDVLDECRFVMPLGGGRSVHLFVEREQPQGRFSAQDLARFRLLAPLIASAFTHHWAWRDRCQSAPNTLQLGFGGGIDVVIRKMRPGQLTAREVEVVALALQGQSAKRAASQLGISEGTVTNHKRNVYEKLAVHSQAQLFSLFLQTLSEDIKKLP